MTDCKSPEDMKQLVTKMREWLNSQPHLPKDVDDRILERFVHSCYFNLEKAQTAADLFFTIRGASPELLSNRDPTSPAMVKALKIVLLFKLIFIFIKYLRQSNYKPFNAECTFLKV
uniref:CRAL/TRIO N-terminal domain-containing protein n=1 Tax=Pectinophora gossypiella TaxID=13191 RepID=A0A1E1WEX8_PECGO